MPLPGQSNAETNLVYTQTDERGVTTTNLYDNLQRLSVSSDPRGTNFLIYDKLDLVETIDRLGFSNEFAYDNVRRMTSQTDQLGHVTTYNYCNCGALDSIADPEGKTTHFFYNNAGWLTNTVYPDGYSTTNNFNLLGQVTNTIDTALTSTTNWFNNQGLRYAVSNAFGQVQNLVFDTEDRVSTNIDANGITTVNTFDDLGRVLTRAYPDGGVEHFVYSAAGLRFYTNQIGMTNFYGYDAAGRKIVETNANREITHFNYDSSGNLTNLIDGKNQNTFWIYDQYSRATNKTDNLGTNIFRYQYDALNRLTNRWTPEKGTTSYSYDAVGNLLAINYPLSPAINFAYDADNRLTNMIDGLGTNSYTYNSVGQLLSEGGLWPDDTVSYSYANRLRTGVSLLQPNAPPWVQTYAWDESKRLTNTTSPAGAFTYSYDPARHMLVSRILLPNSAMITNAFDSVGRVLDTALVNSGGVTLNLHAYNYNLAGQRTLQAFENGNYVDYTYDNIGQLTSARGKESGGSTNRLNEQFGYAYDAAGNLNWRTNNALVECFNVNSLNELTTETNSGTLTVAGTTTADATGVTVSGTGLSSGPAELYADATWARTNAAWINGANSYAASATDSYGRTSSDSVSVNLLVTNLFVYDLNGNLRTNGDQILEYDDENQLTSITISNACRSEFSYDGKLRRRIRKEFTWVSSTWELTNEVHYVYDGNLVIQERWFPPQLGSSLPQESVTYTRGKDISGSFQGAGGIGGLLARTSSALSAINSPLSTAYYHPDGNGNITILINSVQQVVAKYIYDPFGNLFSKSGPLANANVYQFSSKETHIGREIYYYGYRFYNPSTQRWLNRDPVEEDGGINLYEFAHNSPASYRDGFGLATKEDIEELKETLKRIQEMRDLAKKMVDNLNAGKCACWGISSVMASACTAFRDFGHDCPSFAENVCLLITDTQSYQKCKARNQKACEIAKVAMDIYKKAGESEHH